MDFFNQIYELANEIVTLCTKRELKIATAESCTGGMISAAITSVSGSSAVIELGVCSYSNRIKSKVLDVSRETLDLCSEYSTHCAEEMARGVLELSGADFAVSTSGVAGPSGGTPENPVGTVYIGVCAKKSTNNSAKRYVFENIEKNGREYIRARATEQALLDLLEHINNNIERSSQ